MNRKMLEVPYLYETCPAHSSPLIPTKVSSTMSMGSKGVSLPRQGREYQGTLLLPSWACFCRECLRGPGKSLTHAVTYAAARVLWQAGQENAGSLMVPAEIVVYLAGTEERRTIPQDAAEPPG